MAFARISAFPGPAMDRERSLLAVADAGRGDVGQLPAVTLSLVTTREGFAALGADWAALFARAGASNQVFQSYAWCHHWVEHFIGGARPGLRLAIVTARRQHELVMVWPLVERRVAGLKVLSWLGEPVSQYGDVLVEDGDQRLPLLGAGWRFIVETVRPDVVRLNKTRADSAIAPLVSAIGAVTTQRMAAPFLDLGSAPTWNAYETRYSSKARKNRQRQFRRLTERGEVAVGHHRAGEQAKALAREAILLKRAWLKEKGLLSPAISDDRTLAFFESVAGDSGHPVGIRVSALTCGTETAAIEIGFGCGDRMAIHIIVYASAYEKAAAGALLLEACMRESLEAGFKIHDMLAPGGGYKAEWADGEVAVSDHAVPLSVVGRAYVWGYLVELRPRLKTAALTLSRWHRARQTKSGR